MLGAELQDADLWRTDLVAELTAQKATPPVFAFGEVMAGARDLLQRLENRERDIQAVATQLKEIQGHAAGPGAGPQGILLSLIHATSGLTKPRRGETPALKSGALTCGPGVSRTREFSLQSNRLVAVTPGERCCSVICPCLDAEKTGKITLIFLTCKNYL